MARQFTLTVARVGVKINYQQDRASIAGNLAPFLTSEYECSTPQMHFDVTRTGPAFPAGSDGSGVEYMSVLARKGPGGLWFRRSSQCLSANPDFSRCRVWTLPDLAPADPRPFDGRPWLMLALWGYLSARNGVFLHGATAALEGHHVLFLGQQETGKSTLGRLVVEAGQTCLTDEYAILTFSDGTAWAHGSPWPGVLGKRAPLSGPLAATFFLHHAPENTLQRLGPGQALERLLGNARFFHWDSDTRLSAIDVLGQTAQSVPAYDLGFVPDASAVECLLTAVAHWPVSFSRH